MTLVLSLLAAYLVGAIPTGVVLTRLVGGEDIRKAGSGNIGATNVYRVAGKKLGVITLVCDILKGLLPVLLARSAFSPGELALIASAAFLGHCFPVYIGFKGGKGVATALGIFIVLSPAAVLVVVPLFVVLVWKWRYVSLGSICAAGLIPFLVLVFEGSASLFAASLFIGGMVIWRHRSNIERLLAGTENKFKA